MAENTNDLDVIEGVFFSVDAPEATWKGTFHFSKEGRKILALESIDMFYADIPKTYNCIYGEDSVTGERVSLVNCSQMQFWPDLQYLVYEVYKGEWVEAVNKDGYSAVTLSLAGLAQWLQSKAASSMERNQLLEYPLNIDESRQLILKPNTKYVDQGHQKVLIEDTLITLKSLRPTSRINLFRDITSIRNFLTVLLTEQPSIKSIWFHKLDSTSTELFINYPPPLDESSYFQKKVRFEDLEPLLEDSLRIWFKSMINFDEILELYTSTKQLIFAETSFTEIAKVLELIHKYFYEPDDAEENKILREKVVSLMEAQGIGEKGKTKRWTQRMRYTHLWVELEKMEFFKNHWTKPYVYIQMLNESRNYYTHYRENKHEVKHKNIRLVWTANQLFYKNNELRMWAKALLLAALGIPHYLVSTLIWAQNQQYLHIDYEANPYSIDSLEFD